jgi:hypothetical protein
MRTSGGPRSFYGWGAQSNRGTVTLAYTATTTGQALPVVTEDVIGDQVVSLPDPAHTHANGDGQTVTSGAGSAHYHTNNAGQTVTSGAGSSHTHTFTGSGVPDPPNEVFLPYFRR